MKKLFTYIGRAVLFVIGVIVTAIVTALITGQPLSGLSKFQGISRTFISGTVPAWGFALVLMAATLLGSFVLMELWRRRKKIQIHFVPDGYNSGWSKLSETQMHVRIGGIFTYEGPQGNLRILKAYLSGTQPANVDVNFPASDGSGRQTSTFETAPDSICPAASGHLSSSDAPGRDRWPPAAGEGHTL